MTVTVFHHNEFCCLMDQAFAASHLAGHIRTVRPARHDGCGSAEELVQDVIGDVKLIASGARQEGDMKDLFRWAFSYVLYPLVIIGIFYVIGDMLYMLVSAASNRLGVIRRLTGAVFPWVVLIFMFTMDPNAVEPAREAIKSLDWVIQFIIGAVAALLIMELGKHLMGAGGDGSAALYAMFVSGFGAFLVWMAMQGFLASLHYALLGLVTAGALHVIFRGLPEVERKRKASAGGSS